MIICYIGGIGSGKTLSIVKEIVDRKNYPITNFDLKKIKFHRLSFDDLITTDEILEEGQKKPKIIKKVNWAFWEGIRKKHKYFSVYLDEAHNIINARASMSKSNILLSKWVSQIRKVLSDDPVNHLYIITQKPRKIDINFRDLTQIVINCSCIEFKKGKIYIVQDFYDGFDAYYEGRKKARTWFKANPYFKYYDTKEMVTFSDADIYI